MINFQIIKKGKNVWKLFLSELACSFCIRYFYNYILKFKCGGVI